MTLEISRRSKNIIGDRFGRMVVVRLHDPGASGRHASWECRCDCGKTSVAQGSKLANGNTKSCGCLRRELGIAANTTHGRARTPTYRIWVLMRYRCFNPKAKPYKYYGGRGITVCDRWLSFQNFFDDMGERPSGMSIDREDNDGNYEPGNCRWATPKEQRANQRRRVTRSLAS